MRYFLLLSLFLCSCKTPSLPGVKQDIGTNSLRLQPKFKTELYRAIIDGQFLWKKFHLSGVLYLKNFSDTATRIVFQNEMGMTYFDFGWNQHDSFQVHSILDQMNKPALIRTLRKDFELLLFKNMPTGNLVTFQDSIQGTFRLRFSLKEGHVDYILNQKKEVTEIENFGKRKKLIQYKLHPSENYPEIADTIIIEHFRAHFSIRLHKITQHASE